MAKITQISPTTLAPNQSFNTQDFSIIPNFTLSSSFDPNKDTIEYFVYDYNNNLLQSNYNFTNWTPQYLDNAEKVTAITIEPEQDVIQEGYTSGILKTVYNYISPKLSSSFNEQYFISEISSNRTEIRLNSNFLSNEEIAIAYNEFKLQLDDINYFDEFYLNFENNIYILAVNILLDVTTPTYSILIKLYDPLPANIPLKTQTYVVVKTAESTAYQIEFENVILNVDNVLQLKTANFNLPIKNETGPLTNYQTYNSITATPLSGALSQLLTNLDGPNFDLSVDYEDYDNFVFFSSATQRLYNFREKVSNIEDYQNQINALYSTITGSTSQSFAVSSSKAILEKKIQDEIVSFDGYEYFLYYESSSYTWPKSNSTPPYTLYTTGSVQAINWYTTQSISASVYDQGNQNNLEYVIPEFIRSDSDNTNYMLFVNMVGQFFDYIWLYTKGITDKLNANTNLYEGVSKDLVADVLASLGTKVYDSSYTLENIYNAIIGLSPSGSVLVPTGSELITSYVTASVPASTLPTIEDFVKLSYKKIYHNLPYLLKKKGTIDGVRTLINVFGIPDTILRISEFGGKDKNPNTWDQWQNEYNLAYDTSGSNYISSSWVPNSNWSNVPATSVQLRFQTRGIPTDTGYYSQSLWTTNNGLLLRLNYTGSGYASGSFSGSIPSSSNEFVKLEFFPDSTSTSVSASVYLPFFNGDWWSAMVTKNNNTYTLYAANKIYSGSDGNIIGFYQTASVTSAATIWNNATVSYFSSTSNTALGKIFSGSYQEIRYYNSILGESQFKDYTMNPYSTEGVNGTNSAPSELFFRATLGGELYTSSISLHPKVTGSWVATSSFASDSNFFISNTSSFYNNYEYIFFDQPAAGIQNIVSEKITQISGTLPLSSSQTNIPTNKTLSPFISIQQNYPISESYTNDINYVEVALSPQNEINEDINSQIGYFNMGDYIGDPRLISTSAESYPALDILRDQYFEKYTSNYNIWDYIRIIQYYDNALFKMIKDYVPARTSLTTGIVIKQHLLERNKYPVPQVDTFTTTSYYGSGSGSPIEWNYPFVFQNLEITGSPIEMVEITGSQAGNYVTLDATFSSRTVSLDNGTSYSTTFGIPVDPVYNLTQSFLGTNPNLTGNTPFTQSTAEEFINGELSGSNLTVVTQSLNDPYPVDTQVIYYTPVRYSNQAYGVNASASLVEDQFLNVSTAPSTGEVYLMTPTIVSGKFFPYVASSGSSFIKISKFASGGLDQTVPLGQATQISIRYTSPSGVYRYNILNRAEYASYYLYEVNTTQPYTSDNYILNYAVSASAITPIYIGGQISYILSGFNSITGNTLGYFTSSGASDGFYTFQNTPNIPISVTASITVSGSAGSINLFRLALSSPQDPVSTVIAEETLTTGANVIKTISASIYPVDGSILVAGIISNGLFTVKSGSFIVTQSTLPNSAEFDQLIIEPYIADINFANSDDNPIINNAVISRENEFLMDVDFSSNQIIAVNEASILSGSATRATVPESNYTIAGIKNPRYTGKELNVSKFNEWTPGDISFGKTVTVGNPETNFVYFNWVGGTNPEWGNENADRSLVSIKYIINDSGTPTKPINDPQGINLGTIRQTFEEDKSATVLLNSVDAFGSNQSSLNGSWPIFKSGYRIEPIVYTQTASYDSNGDINGYGFTGSINFTQGQFNPSSSALDFTLYTYCLSYQTITTSSTFPLYVDYVDEDGTDEPVILGAQTNYASYFGPATDHIYNGSNSGITSYKLFFEAYIRDDSTWPQGGRTTGGIVTYALQRSTTSFLSGYVTIAKTQINHYATDSGYVKFTEDSPSTGNYYRIVILDSEFAKNTDQVVLSPATYFKVTQYQSPGTGICTSPFWTTGSTSNILNASTASGTGLQEYLGQTQVNIPQSGFNPITNPFNPQIGDEIRFQGVETLAFQIINITASISGQYQLILNKEIPSGTNLNYFLIRRYVDDPSSIILDVDKPAGATSEGILKPQYISPDLDSRIETIIQTLSTQS
jgi:hypothetical protein